MSSKAIGRVWDLKLNANKLIVLLAYADHAEHDGTNIYPSVDKIAWKTGYSSRQVQRVTADLVADGLLVPDGKGPFGTNRYKFDLEAGEAKKPFVPKRKKGDAQGDKLTPDSGGDKTSPNTDGDILTAESPTGGGDILSAGGDILSFDSDDAIVSPKPSESSFEPSSTEKETAADADADNIFTLFEKAFGKDEFAKVAKSEMLRDELKDMQDEYPPDWIESVFRDAAMHHPTFPISYCLKILKGKADEQTQQKVIAAATNGSRHLIPARKLEPAYTPPPGLELEYQWWCATINQLEIQLDRANFDTWLRDCEFAGAERDVPAADPGIEGLVTRFTIACRNEFAVLNLQHRLYRTVRRVLRDIYGGPVEIVFVEKQNAPTEAGHLALAGNEQPAQ